MKVSAVLTRVRDLISDSVKPFRWEDPILITWMNDGQSEIYQERPDAFYRNEITINEPPELTKIGDTVTIRTNFTSELVNFVVQRALARDAEHVPNAVLSGAYSREFKEGIQ